MPQYFRRDLFLAQNALGFVICAFVVWFLISLDNVGGSNHLGMQLSYLSLCAALPLTVSLRPEMYKQRFPEVLLTLPIRAQSLSRSRFLALVITTAGPVLLGWIAMHLFLDKSESVGDRYFLGVLASIVLALAVHDRSCAGRNHLSKSVGLAAACVLFLGVSSTLALGSPLVTGALTCLALIAALRTWIGAPGWLNGSRVVGEQRKERSEPQVGTQAREYFGFVSPILRLQLGGTLFNPSWLGPVAFFGVLGVFMVSRSALIYLPLMVYLLMNLNRASFSGLAAIEHLPVKRNRIAPVVVLAPLLAAVSMSLALDAAANKPMGYQTPPRLVNAETPGEGASESFATLRVPGRLWRLHFGFDSPLAEMAASDRHPAESLALSTYRVLPFLPIAVYNPYETRLESSEDFLAMQVDRCVQAAYGVELGEDAIRQAYIEVDRKGRPSVRLTVDGHPAPRLQDRMEGVDFKSQRGDFWAPILAFSVAWFLAGLISFRRRQFPYSSKWRMRIGFGVSGVVVVGCYAFTLAVEHGAVFAAASSSMLGELLPQDPLLALGTILAVITLPAIYLMRNFCVMDIPTPAGSRLVWTRK